MRSMEDRLDIVDAHHHLWDLEQVHYPWLMERGVRRFFGDPTPIQKDYLVCDFQYDFGELPVKASVHIQVGAAEGEAVRETRWLQQSSQASGAHGLPNAIVAFCDLSSVNAQQVLQEHSLSLNLRGVRQIIGRADEEDAITRSGDLLDNPTFAKHLRILGGMGLSFDLQLTPPQMPKAYSLIRETPDTPIALCHCGSPWDRSLEGLKFWRQNMAVLASLPNVVCKLSGFGMFDPQWNTQSVKDIVLFAIDTFGPERCMFGSNFPVDKLYKSYFEVYGHFMELIEGFSQAEKQLLLADSARRFYRI